MNLHYACCVVNCAHQAGRHAAGLFNAKINYIFWSPSIADICNFGPKNIVIILGREIKNIIQTPN